MKKSTTNPDKYIDSLSGELKEDISILDKKISKVMNKHSRTLWEGIFWGGSDQKIIGYGDLVFKGSNGKEVEWFIVGLAVQKNYISVYLSGVDNQKYVAEKYGKTLGKVKVGKSSIGFKKLDDIDLDKLIHLVERTEELSAKK